MQAYSLGQYSEINGKHCLALRGYFWNQTPYPLGHTAHQDVIFKSQEKTEV